MYKRWIIEQDSSTNTRINWLNRFFSEFEKILTEIGIEYKSSYSWSFRTNSNSINCISNNLSALKEKGYPEWICGFKDFPNINLYESSMENILNTYDFLQNYSEGFLSFTINNTDYCFTYRLANDSMGYFYTTLTLLVQYDKNRKYKQTIDWESLGNNINGTGSSVYSIGKWGVSNHILVEYHNKNYINMINLTFNGLASSGGDYYSSGKFISLGNYYLSDGMFLSFPGGFLAETENLDSTMFNKLCFCTDSQGLITLINGNLGDQTTGIYIKGNIYYGIKNTRIIGKLENAVTINNYNFDTGTVFTYNGHRYGKIKIPMINNEVCSTTDYSKYGTALSLAFHKDIYEDTESN